MATAETASSYVRYALSFFPDAKRAGAQFMACCCCHDERTPSLAIREGDDGRALFKCHGCGAGYAEVVRAKGMDPKLLAPVKREREAGVGEIVATYDYRTAAGELLYQAVRFRPKDFRQRRPGPGGAWVYNLQGVRRVLYRLSEVLAAVSRGERVYVVEGEKDADALARLGLCATTNAMGAKAPWLKDYSEALCGADVAILPDHDEPGREHAEKVRRALRGVARSVRVLALPGLPEHGDVSDWLAAGGTREALEALIEECPANTAPQAVPATPAFAVAPTAFTAVPAFPLEALPQAMSRFAAAASLALPAPVDFVAVPAVVLAGVAIGTSRELEIKPGWREGPRIFAGVVADPGSKKSPAMAYALAPAHRRQERYRQDYLRMLEDYRRELAIFERKDAEWKDAVRRRAAGQSEMPKKPEPPVMRQVYTTNATMEAQAVLLCGNPRGMLLHQDELTAWVRSMDAYRQGKGADRQGWLSFWNGSPHVINRKGSGEPIILPNPFLSVVGCLPPEVLSELTEERGRDDGFLHRILFAYPERMPVRWTEESVPFAVETDYHELFERLWRLEAARDPDDNPVPVRLRMLPAAKDAFRGWAEAHYAEMRGDFFPDNLRGAWAKAEGYFARLTLIIHCCRWVSGETPSEHVDEASVAAAAVLIGYFKAHAQRVYLHLQETPEDQRARRALEWIEREGRTATARQFLRSGVVGVKTASEAQKILLNLADRGFGSCTRARKDSLTFTAAPREITARQSDSQPRIVINSPDSSCLGDAPKASDGHPTLGHLPDTSRVSSSSGCEEIPLISTTTGGIGQYNGAEPTDFALPVPLELPEGVTDPDLRRRCFDLAAAKGYPRVDLPQDREVPAGEAPWRRFCIVAFAGWPEKALERLERLP